ncbi:MAG: lipopolysaccharide biosynthesis protein [Acidobacteria bacterium]|nr:lipopolysaccharide biosynthesis protein [Acidobacteriota bacterium]
MLGHRTLTADDYFKILKRRRMLIIIPVIIAPIIALAIAFAIPPQYLSQTLVLIEQQKVPDDYVKPVISSDLDQRLASMKEQILSRSRIQPIIDRFNLYPNKSADEKVEIARKNIAVTPIHSTITHSGGLPGFFISFKASDPHIAQQVCGEITSLFVGENLRARQQSAQGTTSFLEAQLAEAKASLDEQDKRLADFQRKYIGKLPDEASPNMNMLQSLNTQLEAATQALARMEQDKTYQESLLAQQTHDSSPTGAKSSGIDERQVQLAQLQAQATELSARYTPDYPDLVAIRRKITDLQNQIARSPVPPVTSRVSESPQVQQLRAQIRASEQGIMAKRREQMQLQSSIRMYQDRIQSSPLVEEQYKQVTRDYQTAQKFYDDLLAKMNQSKMATDLERRQQGEQFRVMDEPNLPDSPSFPKPWLFALGGLAAGLLIGLTTAAILEYKNTAIRSERDVYAFLKLPTLATISLAAEAQTRQTSANGAQKKGFFRRKHSVAEAGARG